MSAESQQPCPECGLWHPCKTCGGGGKPRLALVPQPNDEELRAALKELLAVSRGAWAAMVEHEGPPVLAGKADLALAFIAAGNRAAAALGDE
jgi:hypothetical protein